MGLFWFLFLFLTVESSFINIHEAIQETLAVLQPPNRLIQLRQERRTTRRRGIFGPFEDESSRESENANIFGSHERNTLSFTIRERSIQLRSSQGSGNSQERDDRDLDDLGTIIGAFYIRGSAPREQTITEPEADVIPTAVPLSSSDSDSDDFLTVQLIPLDVIDLDTIIPASMISTNHVNPIQAAGRRERWFNRLRRRFF